MGIERNRRILRRLALLVNLLVSSFLMAFEDTGRVEVEGFVVTANIKPPPSIIYRSGAGGEFEVELTVAPVKPGTELPMVQFEGPIRAVDADGRALAKPSRFRPGIY